MSDGIDFKLYPKQAAALTTDANFILYGGSCGSGKLLNLNTFIPTPHGSTTMGKIKVGDKVFDRKGLICNVVAKSDTDYDEQAYEITFRSGTKVIAGENHEWLILNPQEKYYRDIGAYPAFGKLRKTAAINTEFASWYIPKTYGEGYHEIVSVAPVENPGMQCIQVDSEDHTYLITEDCIATHNSFLIRAASIIYAIEIPGSIGYIFRKNYGDLISNHVDSTDGFLSMLNGMLQAKLVKWNKSDYSFVFANGSRIQLAHLNSEADLGNYLGRELTYLIIDESCQLSGYAIMYLISRLRLGGLQIPDKWKGKFPRCILATNPIGLSKDWHKKRFVDFGTEIHQAPADWGGMRHQYIPALLHDNKVLCENDPTYADKIKGLSIDSPELVEAMLSGNWEVSASNAITHWDRKIHVIDPFPIPKSWKIYRAYDYGYSAPYAVIYYAVSNGEDYIDSDGVTRDAPKDSMFVVGEIYGGTPDGKGVKEQPAETAERVKVIDEVFAALGHTVRPGPADNSIFNKDRGESIAGIFQRHGIAWARSNKNPGSRVLGLQILNQMVKDATKDVPEAPIFKVFKTCPNTAKQLPNLQVDPRKQEDVDTKGEDHIFDTVRYSILHSRDMVQTKKVVGI